MSNTNRDFLIKYDIKRSNISIEGNNIFFYTTDKNVCNIFVSLVANVSTNPLISKYVNVENASNYTLKMMVMKPNNEIMTITGTLMKAETTWQFDLTQSQLNMAGEYKCQLHTITTVRGRTEETTSDPFGFVVKKTITDDVDDVIDMNDNYTVQLINMVNDMDSKLEAKANELSLQIKQKMDKGESISITQIDKNKGKIDETYLSDELLQQMAGNTPIYNTVRDFSLTTRKMGFDVLEGISNGNLFNKYWTIDGFYVSEGDGTLLANNEFFVSEPIPVKPNTTYTINSSNRYAFYDSEGKFINGTIGTGKNETFTTPSNAYYFRTCNLIANKDTVSLVEGNEVKQLESYKVLLNPNTIIDKSITKDKLSFEVPNMIPSKNLFNKATATKDKYVLFSDGIEYGAEGFYASDFIKIEPNTTYIKNNNQQLAFYDSEGNFISGLKNPVITFTTPENAYYVRVTVEKDILDSFQLEKGSESTEYETFDRKIDINNIANKSISKNKLPFEVPDMIPSKNLFNKDTAIKDKYILYLNGIVDTASGFYASDFIEVEPNTTYTKNDSQQLAFYDNEKIFISGLKNPVTTFTTPENSKYVRVTVIESMLNSLQLEKGSESTEYETFDIKIDPKHIKMNSNNTVKNVVTVAKENGDYKTINEALANIKDSKENQITIKLAPGEYVENVNTIGRYVSIIGENKDTCIIKTYTNDYYHPPLDCSANNYFSNLTVIADDDGVTTPVNGVNNLPAYALHFDISGRYNKDLEENHGIARFENVIFISKHQHAVGIGISHNQHLIFENCEFIAFNDPAFRAHNYQLAGASNEKMTVRNCVMRNDGTYTPIVLQDPNHYAGADDNRETIFTFINNVAYNAQGKNNCLNVATPLADGCVAGYIKLGIGSFGNSIDKLNY